MALLFLSDKTGASDSNNGTGYINTSGNWTVAVASNVVTVDAMAAHGYDTGDVIETDGNWDVNTFMNNLSNKTITVTGANTFTFPLTQANQGATAETTVTAMFCSPFATTLKATQSVSAGDTVYFRGGTYDGRVVFAAAGTAGTSGNYITYTFYPGESPIITADTTNGSNNIWLWLLGGVAGGDGTSYVKIIGLTFDNYSGGGIISYGQTTFFEIRDCTFSDQKMVAPAQGGSPIRVQSWNWASGTQTFPDDLVFNDSSNIIIDNNTFTNIQTGFPGDPAFDELCTMVWKVQYVQYTNNTINGANHIGFNLIGKTEARLNTLYSPALSGGDKFPQYVIISGNTVIDCGDNGNDTSIYIDGAKDVVVEDNLVKRTDGTLSLGTTQGSEDAAFITDRIIVRRNRFKNMWRGLGIGSPTPGGTAQNLRICHNTVWSDYDYTPGGNTAQNFVLLNTDVTKVEAINNVSVLAQATNVHSYHLFDVVQDGTSPLFNYNCYWPQLNTAWGRFWNFNNSFEKVWTTYQATTNVDEDESLLADPDLTSPGTDDFTLGVGSPCANAGRALTTTDDSGTGTVIGVADTYWFTDRHGLQTGDLIRVGDDTVTVTAVNHTLGQLTVTPSITWASGEDVNYEYNETGPDIGWYEAVADVPSPYKPVNDLTGNPYHVTVSGYLTLTGLSVGHQDQILAKVEFDSVSSKCSLKLTTTTGNVVTE